MKVEEAVAAFAGPLSQSKDEKDAEIDCHWPRGTPVETPGKVS